jgi:hypothetical protein
MSIRDVKIIPPKNPYERDMLVKIQIEIRIILTEIIINECVRDILFLLIGHLDKLFNITIIIHLKTQYKNILLL